MGGDTPGTRPVSNSREKSLWLPGFRKRGEKILHSKYIVICVIFLTISDCALVIGELILDLYSVKISLQESVGRSSRFLNGLKFRYPDQFKDDRMLNIDYVMDRILSVEINWDNVVDFGRQNLTNNLYSNFLSNHTRHKRSSPDSVDYSVPDVTGNASLFKPIYKPREEIGHSREEYIAHCLHYASLSVLSILLLEVSLKILCAGSHFVKRKIEVFDAVIILLSFIVDLIFLKGLSNFAISDSIFILAFLLPWRVIRVVNSLVVAVIDHEHVKLRLLYSRKKKLDKTVDNLRNEVDELKGLLHEVRTFCIKDGMEEWKIDNLLGKFAPRRRKDSKFYTLVKLVMSTASVNDDKDSVSSGSMDNEISQFARRESVLNEYDGCSTSNENTVNSFNFLTVPNAYDTGSIISDNDISVNSRRSSIDDTSRRSSVTDLVFPVPRFIVTNPEINKIPTDIESIGDGSTNQISPTTTRKGATNQQSPYNARKTSSNRSPANTRKQSPNHLSPLTCTKSSSSKKEKFSRKKSSSKQSSKQSKNSSSNQNSPTITRNNSTNRLSPTLYRSNQQSPSLSRNSSANQILPCINRNSLTNELLVDMSENISTNEMPADYNGNTSANETSPCLSRKNSTNELTPCLSRNNSANQLAASLSRNSSTNDLSENCKDNRARVRRSPQRVNFALS